ncbi:hypothetical protein [Pedobacter sp.]|uniref:hypothetical protein n=1 Tax=Pedobacter sp. TaxID=1411316 RepID=UPI00396CED73
MNVNDVAKVFDTILSIPGMGEAVKIDLRMSRKNVLLLNQVIELGIAAKAEDKTGLLDSLSHGDLEELKTLANDCLSKAGLNELSEKLKLLASK